MLLNYENRTQIYDAVVKLQKGYYNVHPSNDVFEYIDSLPKTLFSWQMYDDEEFKLLEMLGYRIDELTLTKKSFDYVLSQLEKSMGRKIYVNIYFLIFRN
jgi:hypothetical protein